MNQLRRGTGVWVAARALQHHSTAPEVQSYSGIAPVMEQREKGVGCISVWPARSFYVRVFTRVFTNGRVTPSRTRCGHEATINNYAGRQVAPRVIRFKPFTSHNAEESL